jgi:hypothetical protein
MILWMIYRCGIASRFIGIYWNNVIEMSQETGELGITHQPVSLGIPLRAPMEAPPRPGSWRLRRHPSAASARLEKPRGQPTAEGKTPGHGGKVGAPMKVNTP